MNASSGQADRPIKKDKNQNIQVFVRLRPLNARERDIKSIGIVEVSGNREIVVRQPALDNKLTKKFVFDRAFGPFSKQVEVYHEVVSPLIEEVLAGYNCTVFAYGQTGTGKTHTMVGESSSDGDIPWQNDPMAGIIPRSLSQLFDELRLTNAEYTVRVSYLELYNEELFDLLSSSEDNSKLRIYEDVTRKGSNIVNGLEEMTVYNKNEVYKIMAKGQEKRRTASTLMNAQSSRSHTVFTITVHMKENSVDGEELMKIGKLNLVDLAGSENISKAGTDIPSKKERARECVNINQSLLTLGRVITSLVERHPHIPYRESKLTRLLQESLGGRTKTSIIATISPGHRDVEETLSTLEYANRARNIQNKPEINQKLTKVAVLKEYSEEIDRLKRDLTASRERNGVYLATESYANMTLKLEEQEKEIQDQILYIKALKEEKDRVESLFGEMSNNLKETENKLTETNQTLDHTKNLLVDKKKELVQAHCEIGEQKYLVDVHVETEKKLSEQANCLLEVADTTTTDVDLLQNALDKKRSLENKNLTVTKSFGSKSQHQRGHIKEYMNSFIDSNLESVSALHTTLDSHLNNYESNQTNCKKIINEMFNKIVETMSMNNTMKEQHVNKISERTTAEFKYLKESGEVECNSINEKLESLTSLLIRLDESRERDRHEMENMSAFVKQWKDSSITKMLNLRNVQSEWCNDINVHMKNINDQYNANESYNVEEVKKISDLRKQQDDEINADLKSLKEMIVAIEKKRSQHHSQLNVLDDSHVACLKSNQESFTTLMKSGEDSMAVKIQDMNHIVNAFDDTNKSFVKDISTKLDDYRQRVALGQKLDQEVKVSVHEVSEQSKSSWNKHFKEVDLVMHRIEQTNTETITEQCKIYNEFLTQCHGESDKIIKPIEDSIKDMSEQRSYQNDKCERLESTMSKFREDMNTDLLDYDEMESKFLNEEYKSYSPTGKTPNRRDYVYPQELAATSPHERIIMRHRRMYRENMRNRSINGTLSPLQIDHISLDNTIEASPLKHSIESSRNLSENLSPSVLEDSVIFTEPKYSKNLSAQNNSLSKSSSENDIYILNSNKTLKENWNHSSNDKKELISKIRPPSVKKVLGTKNY